MACNIRNKVSTMVFADTTIMGYSKSIEKFVSGEMSLKGLLPRLITTPFIGLMVSGILNAILPGCTTRIHHLF